MYILVLAVHIIVSLFLIFIILIQSSKGEGLSDVFGGGSSQTTIFGTRTGTFLTKATTASAVIFMLTSLSLTLLFRQKAGSVVQQELIKEQVNQKIEQMMKGKAKPQDKQAQPANVSAENKDVKPLQQAVPQQDNQAKTNTNRQ